MAAVNVVEANTDSDISHSHWIVFDCYEEGTLKPGKTSILNLGVRKRKTVLEFVLQNTG